MRTPVEILEDSKTIPGGVDYVEDTCMGVERSRYGITKTR